MQFFRLTNFCSWLLQPLTTVPDAWRYSRDLTGMMNCFIAGLPFYQREGAIDVHAIFVGDPRFGVFGLVAGDLFFTCGLFGLHAVLARLAFPAERADVQPSVQTIRE